MKMRKWIILLAVVFTLSGCKEEEQNITNDFTVSGDPSQSITMEDCLTLSMRIPETLNPLRNREESVDRVLKLMYQPLIEFDQSGKAYPMVAASWSFDETGTMLTVQLNQGLRWQNGGQLTADDVIFSLDTIAGAAEDSVYKDVFSYISGYTKTGTHSLNITFGENFSKNIHVLNFPIISQGYYQGQTDVKSSVNMTPMGSGAYELASYTQASELMLRASQTYSEGTPQVSEIKVQMTAGDDTDIHTFDQGMIDVLVGDAITAGRYADEKGWESYPYDSHIYDFVAFNFNRSLFQDKTMRQAVAYAINREEICESVYLDYAMMASTPVSPRSYLYEENVIDYGYDLAMAATLLKNSGWISGDGNRVLHKVAEGEDVQYLQVTILVNQENKTRQQIAQKLKEELTLLGFGVTIDAQPFEQFEEKFRAGEYDMVVGGWQMSVATDLYTFFGTNGIRNYIGYQDVQTDLLLEKANKAIGEGQTLLAYSSLQKRLAEEIPYISIAYRNHAIFTSSQVGGEILPTAENVYRNIIDWTFEKDSK